jgi:hypothetical protein
VAVAAGHPRDRPGVVTGDQAVLDRLHLARPVLAQPADAAGAGRPLDPRPPAQAVLVAGHRLDHDREVDAREPSELLADDRRLELPLVGQRHVLEVAAAAAAGRGVRAGGRDPLRRRLEHLDGVRAPEAVAVGPLGDLEDDALPRDRVPDEDHPRPVRRRVVGSRGARAGDAGHAVAAVGHRADHRLEALPDPRAAACLPPPWRPRRDPPRGRPWGHRWTWRSDVGRSPRLPSR